MPGNFGLSLSFARSLFWTLIVCLRLLVASSLQLPSTAGASFDFWHEDVPLHSASLPHIPTVRWGEATHPGPSTEGLHLFGFSNCSGFRLKEETALSLGPGVWSFEETYLTTVTQRSCSKQLRYLAAQSNRSLRIHLGAPVAPRANSTWAGTWSGVATLSDHPSYELNLPYTGERACGRVLVTRHMINNQAITNAVVYAYPKGPTWPQATRLTSNLLQVLTHEVVLGGVGVRLVGGDFNASDSSLEIFQLWRQYGWETSQNFALRHWGQCKQMTCKGATECDLVWLSPEAQAVCRMVDVADIFADHATVSVGLDITVEVPRPLKWVKPSRIPWELVGSQWAHTACPPEWLQDGPPDELWKQWASSFESNLTGHIPSQPGRGLQAHQRGRFQQTQPQVCVERQHHVRPSRPSEVVLRNDMIGTSVKLWFKQLRRLQSYHASIKAGKTSPHAVAYRLELWSCILRSPGFEPSFTLWWSDHCKQLVYEEYVALPPFPPSAALAEQVFYTFKANFEAFESWNLRQRRKLLQAKYDTSMKGIFQDLKDPMRDKLDILHSKRDFVIEAISPDTSTVTLDADMVMDGFSTWTCGAHSFQPEPLDFRRLRVPDPSLFEVGSQLCQTLLITGTSQIHQQLLDFWTPTWTALPAIDPTVWTRVTGFFRAYVPRLALQVEPITVPQWTAALKRYKKTAARGVDGLSHIDLQSLPTSWTQRLLDLLNAIEVGQSDWPSAILYGVVSVISKDLNSRTVDRFRPIVIFSIVYRTWASLRAKQLLRLLLPHLNVEAFGFLPNCETSQMWLVLQGEIETMLQSGEPLCGLSTDLVRAFNNVPRQHSFALAEHLGVDDRVLRPWQLFLSGCTRAFDIRGVLSPSQTSNCGLPEGDAMSVYAMTQLCFAWHLYQRAYCPSVRSLSFVDNLSLVSPTPALLIQAFACLQAFFQLWNLTLDLNKSYCWALTAPHRLLLAAMPMQRVDHAHELGGVLSFTKRHFTGLQVARFDALQPKWKRLQSSFAPLCQKLAAVPIVFWTSALYGTNGSCLGEGHLDRLRTQALKALKLGAAGVNGLLRLSLSTTPEADPGFWRLKTTLQSFLRLLRKEPRLLNLWTEFMHQFDGCLFSGPFSQLLTVLNQIGWRIEPPFLIDHDQCRFHILGMDSGALPDLLYDGWLQYVSRTVSRRKTMNDLDGLHTPLLPAGGHKMDALSTSLVAALQSGAFMNQAAQSRFDLTKNEQCSICGVPDTTLHWIECPRHDEMRVAVAGFQLQHPMDTVALVSHLLPSRSPFESRWKEALLAFECDADFLSAPGPGCQHVFTDGSATKGSHPYQVASWAVLNASTGLQIQSGPLPGVRQTSDRAELQAALQAVKWQLHFGAEMHLWMDAKYVSDGIARILRYGEIDCSANQDLWSPLTDLVNQVPPGRLMPHWVPSHLDAAQMTCPFEDWVKTWNDKVDFLAGQCNEQRALDFKTLRSAAIAHHERLAGRFWQLQQFFLQVAGTPSTEMPDNTERPDVSLFDFELQCSLIDVYVEPLQHWIEQCDERPHDIPAPFIVQLYDFLLGSTAPEFAVYNLSFEELTLWIVKDTLIPFPFLNPHTGCMETQALCLRYERPTFGYLFKQLRKALLWLFKFVDGCDEFLFVGGNKVDLGIHKPTDGLYIRLPASFVQQCQQLVLEFTRSRPLRQVCDYARPC